MYKNWLVLQNGVSRFFIIFSIYAAVECSLRIYIEVNGDTPQKLFTITMAETTMYAMYCELCELAPLLVEPSHAY